MIYGIGIDIVEIDRIKNSMKKFKNRFLGKIFTKKEIMYCSKNIYSHELFAGRFAAKEAFLKAIKVNQDDKISWHDIEICKKKDGSVYISLSGRAEFIVNKHAIKQIQLSISHERKFATAIVTAEV